jgi:hypothetical protein
MDGMTGRLVGAAPGEHFAMTYGTERSLVEPAGLFLAAGLRNGEDARLIAAPAHLDAICAYLARLGVDVLRLRRAGRLRTDDAVAIAEDLLSGRKAPTDAELRRWMRSVLGPERGRPIRVYGEVVGFLVAAGRADLALRIECRWNAVLKERPIAVFCGYADADFADGLPSEPHRRLAAEHLCMPAL